MARIDKSFSFSFSVLLQQWNGLLKGSLEVTPYEAWVEHYQRKCRLNYFDNSTLKLMLSFLINEAVKYAATCIPRQKNHW